ncbi:MAG: hypothetical protein LUG12_01870 [Erysipelotrichaceae bacterium]|nr:hypothetical protein [Erysipelotrichaceae bacterium]
MKRIKLMYEAIKMELMEHKASAAVYLILRALVLIIMILQILNQNYENAFLCILVLILFIVPSFIQVRFKIELPTTLEVIILIFIFCAEILGEIQSFYTIFPMWDTVLHTLNGFLAAAIGFSLVDIMNNDDRLQFHLSPLFMAIVAFCFSMTIGAVWEIMEYFADTFLGLDAQKDTIIHSINSVALDPTNRNIIYSIDNITNVMINGEDLGLGGYLDIGLIDTMNDLIVNFIGAFTFSIFGYFYVKNRDKPSFITRFIPRKKEAMKDYLKLLDEKWNKDVN